MWKAVLLTLALAGCASDEQHVVDMAWSACQGVEPWQAHSACLRSYYAHLDDERARTDAIIGGALLNRPVQTSCMNIGGIVTCTSR